MPPSSDLHIRRGPQCQRRFARALRQNRRRWQCACVAPPKRS